MSEHRATIEWQSDGQFRSGRYSRVHKIAFDGGVELTASASPQVVPVPMADPAGVDPEEMLVASASSCHMLWFLDLARHAGLAVASYKDEACGALGNLDGTIGITRIVLKPAIDFDGDRPDEAAISRLHHEAHVRCYIANSLKCEVVVEG